MTESVVFPGTKIIGPWIIAIGKTVFLPGWQISWLPRWPMPPKLNTSKCVGNFVNSQFDTQNFKILHKSKLPDILRPTVVECFRLRPFEKACTRTLAGGPFECSQKRSCFSTPHWKIYVPWTVSRDDGFVIFWHHNIKASIFFFVKAGWYNYALYSVQVSSFNEHALSEM